MRFSPRANEDNIFFLHCHLQKCAGTSFIQFLKKNLGNRHHSTALIVPEAYDFNPDSFVETIALRDDFDALSAHRCHINLDYKRAKRRIVSIAFVRDPVQRVFSHYYFEKQLGLTANPAINLPFHEYLRHLSEHPEKPFFRNFNYLDSLLGGPNKGGIEKIETLCERRDLFLFPSESLVSAQEILTREFPSSFSQNIETIANASQRPQSNSLQEKELATSVVPKENFQVWKLAKALLPTYKDQPDPTK